MEISIIWTTENVLHQAKEKGVKLTEDEADEILLHMERKHDADIGISWTTIDVYIDGEKIYVYIYFLKCKHKFSHHKCITIARS